MSNANKDKKYDSSAMQPKAPPAVDQPRTEPAPIQPQVSQDNQAPLTPERKS